MLAASLAIFFLSGFAGLVYQVIWQRLLGLFSGADVHSATLVVGAFMAGLGCGSLAGGHIADRVSPQRSLLLFAAAEFAVALFGFASSTLFYDVLYQRFGHVSEVASAAMLFVVLLWPTFFMGLSLPLLARGVTTDIARAAPTVGWLYGFNTLGAATGALCATWLLIPQLGLDGSLKIAASFGVLCALGALPIVWMRSSRSPAPSAAAASLEAAADAGGDRRLPSRLSTWVVLFAASGFLGLSLEIVWFRLLGVMVKSTSFTFGTLLALYLLGLGLGGVIGGLLAARVRRPAVAFLALQAAAGGYAALSLGIFLASTERGAGQWFATYFNQYDAIDIRRTLSEALAGGGENLGSLITLYVLLPAALIGPPTTMMGMSFVMLQRVVQRDLAHLGRRVGELLAANIAGSTLGAFVTGWLLLGALRTSGTLRLLFMLSAGFGFLALRRALAGTRRPQQTAAVVTAIMLVAGAAILPGQQLLWARLHGATPMQIIAGEDGTGVSVLKADGPSLRRVVVYVNGLGQSWIPYGDIHTALGALPAFIHPAPQDAALIGLGSGDTLYALAGRRELERIASIEIIGPQLATLRELMRRTGYPGLQAILSDARIEHVIGDGRIYLRRAARRFDIIEADALRPTSAYSGNLYSDAYFALLRAHLKPGGLAVTWAPTPRIERTFIKAFPYVRQQGTIMLGSDAPIEIDRAAILQRLRDPRVLNYYTQAGVDIEQLLQPYIESHWRLYDPVHDRAAITDVNTDLHPRDEFDIPPLVELPRR